ncbi:serine/threonine-protein kinase Nek4-like isoform X2 [Littorina saxatilis]|uniref:serine/threonine-protein kinase Nek4-like isoform X2 n=1 Tax=Littorina saxatilis TaxID=31220 RepID=UPI0038B4593A
MQQVKSRWQIERELGKGSYGSVYLLTQLQSITAQPSPKYALKVIDEQGARAQDREEARKELCIMGRLCHPSIVSLVDSFEVSPGLLLVLELCQGGDLRSFLDNVKVKRRPESGQRVGVDEALVVTWTQQLADGLQYLHQKKILHRDLKPQNIFLKDKMSIKIGDLGIARQLVFTKEMADTHIGTPLYISPEIYQGNPYNYKTDVWSLGCCVYEMMTLEYAFHAPSRFELVGKVVTKQVVPLPGCYSKALQGLVLSMLHKDPGDRPHASQILQSVTKMGLQHLKSEQHRQKLESTAATRPEKPQDTGSLQAWRLAMAEALHTFLHKKHATQSAQLAAALREKLSLDSIRDIHDSTGGSSAGDRGGRHESTRNAEQFLSSSDCEEEDISGSLSLSFSERSVTSSLVQRLDGVTNTQSSSTAQSIVTLRSDSKDRRVGDGGDSDAQSDSSQSDSDLYSENSSVPQVMLEPRLVKIGKSSAVIVKTRPLPHPRLNRDQTDCDDRFQQASAALSSAGNLSTLASNMSQSEKTRSTEKSLSSTSQSNVEESHESSGTEDIHQAYANQIMKWAKGKFLTLASLNDDNQASSESGRLEIKKAVMTSNTEGDPSQVVPVTSDSKGDTSLASNEDGRHGQNVTEAGVLGGREREDGERAAQHELGKQERGKKKKRNFLKERKGKLSDEKVGAIASAQDDVQGGVRLYTRAQRVTFTNTKLDDLDLTVGHGSFS